MSFDLRWLHAKNKQVLAAAPADWKRTPMPRAALITFGLAAVAAVGLNRAHVLALDVVATIAVIVAVISAYRAWRALATRFGDPRRLRLALTAATNGFRFAETGITSVDATLLHAGHDVIGDQFFWNGNGAEFGALRYTTGNGRNRSIHEWHYVAARLPAPLPHMMLDSRTDDFLGSDLPETFARNQRLSLEGDFDRHFTLYAPREYQRDALYVFTPDVMAAFIDDAADYNVEIVDDAVIFFAQPGADFENPRDWADLDRILHGAVPKLAARASRYLDDHAGPQQATRAIDAAAAAAAHAEAMADASSAAALAAASPRPVIAPQGRRLKASRRALRIAGIAGLAGIGGIVMLGLVAIDLIYGSIAGALGS